MARRGAWRQSRRRRLPRFCSDAVPHRPCNAPTLPVASVPVGAALKTPAASNLRAPTRPMARAPRGERKDALDTVALRRCRAQVASIAAAAAASVGVKPQAEAPHSAPVAPRNALRRRLRRRTCTARARAQRHRSVLRARAGPTWESERISSVARALQGARRKGRAGRWQMERLL